MSDTVHHQSHSLQVLEYRSVFAQVLSLVRSDDGRKHLADTHFMSDARTLEIIQQESRALQELLLEYEYPLPAYPDIDDALEDSRVEGTVLELEQCAEVAQYVDAASRELGFLQPLSPGTALESLAARAYVPAEIGDVIWKYLDRSGRLMEEKIPELQRIAARIRNAAQSARETAYRFLRNASYKDFWSSDEPALRDGRLVLPLQENFRGRLSGIVHTRSASGATIFFEPGEIVEANNRVSEEESAYQLELQRILRRMTAVIRDNYRELQQLRLHIGRLDDRCARARFALKHQAIWAPVHPSDRRIRLVQARHPLLGKDAVPISLEISGDPERFIVLSGPNTGGKTVALKTLGLFAALHQHGLPVPAADGTKLPLFSAVHADIGDEQSIERSLSTFSGHIGRIKTILHQVDRNGLVLLDELGTGTDPDEAGALGVAICEYLTDVGCLGIITTHLWALKEFSFSSPHFFNAAMAFDEQTHRPTFAVVPGLPGSSYALDTAESIGLPRIIMQRAREVFAAEQSSSAATLRRLAEQERRIEEQHGVLERTRNDLEARQRQLDQQAQTLSERESEVRRGQLRELDQLLSEGRSRIEQTIKSIREEELSTERIQQAKAQMKELEHSLESVRIKHQQHRRQTAATDLIPQPGAKVRIRENNKQGVIQRSAGKQRWKVAFGSISLTVHEDDFTVTASPAAASTVQSPTVAAKADAPKQQPVYTVDLRGMRVHEAEQELLKYLDAAVVQGSSSISIIHGKGSGALQQALHGLLREHPLVKGFQFARPELGGSGKTEVTLAD